MTENIPHIPVLAKETLEYAMPSETEALKVVDCTVGYGGHSSLILRKNPFCELLGLDRDANAIAFSKERLAFAGSRVKILKTAFSDIAEAVREAGWETVDSILMDIGVSSPQIDNPERGFSFRFDAALDMRMDADIKKSAYDVVNSYTERELGRVFREYGELREASKLARAIVREREKSPIESCKALAEICEKALFRPGRRNGPPVPTLAFQALRIEVNDELGELEKALESAVDLLNENGRITVISFHSLEDRVVKHFFRGLSHNCVCPPTFPVCVCGGKMAKLEILTTKPVTASEEELEENTRSACAKLRCAKRIKF